MKKERAPKKAADKKQKQQRKKLIILFIMTVAMGVVLFILVLLKRSKTVSEFVVTKIARNILLVMGRFSSALPFSLYELFLYIAGIAVICGIVAIIIGLVVIIIKIIREGFVNSMRILFALLLTALIVANAYSVLYFVSFAVICGIIALIIKNFRKRFINSLRMLLAIILTGLIFVNIYFVSAGFSYNRYDEYFPTHSPDLSREQMVWLAEYFVDDFNSIAESLHRDENGCAIMPYSTTVLSDKLRQEYLRLNGYNINNYTPKAKVIFSSGIMSEMHISGVFFAPFGEANVNGLIPDYSMPFTMAHEMAHAKGVMREDEANEVALYITLTSSDPFIRYSGYAKNIYTLLDAVWAWEKAQEPTGESDYRRLYYKISPLLDKDYAGSVSFWDSRTALNDFFSKLNNLYLKIMGQKEGTGAYSPPDTPVVDEPVIDPGTGDPVVDPGTGEPVTRPKPDYNTVQQIFFQAYLEKNGSELTD